MPPPDPWECSFLFVYGSLKRAKGHPQHEHLRRHAVYLGDGLTRGQLYRIDWYPALIPSTAPEAWVSGEIYRMHDPVPLLRRLDAFECYDPLHPEDSEYLRVLQEVQHSDGPCIQCQLYVYQRPVDSAQHIASGTF